MAQAVLIRLGLRQVAALLQVADDRLAAGEAVHPLVRPGLGVHRAVQRDGVDRGQAVALADLEVDRVVAGRDLERAGAELPLDRLVADDRQLAFDDRELRFVADEGAVAFVLGVDGDAGVGDDRLRPGGGDRDRLAGRLALVVEERVADVPEVAFLLAMHHLQVGEGGLAARAPVDDPLASIDQPLLIEVVEGGADGLGRAFVHGEAFAAPVGRGAQPPVLVEDARTASVDERPDALQEALAADVVARQPLGRQLPLDQRVHGDGGVVDAGQPEGRVAHHAMPANEDVLHRVHQRVAQVELAGKVGRRHDDHERVSLRVVVGGEISGLFPHAVEARLDGGGIVGFGHRCLVAGGLV